MIQQAINTTVAFVVSGVLGFCVSQLKGFKKQKKDILAEFKQIKDNQMLDMRNDLSNKFYVYDSMEKVEDYLVMAFREKCERYFELGGDSWVHPMYDKSFKWKIKKTGYLG
jgi:hypothetical protein